MNVVRTGDITKFDDAEVIDMEEYSKEVLVSKKDKDELLNLCENINNILNKYPYKKDYNSYYVTIMARVKNAYYDLASCVKCLKNDTTEK